MATTISGSGAHAAVEKTDRIPASKAGVKGYHEVGSLGYLKGEIDDMLRGLAAGRVMKAASGARAGIDLDFASVMYTMADSPKTLADIVTFTRASTAYDTMADGSLVLTAANTPRLGLGLGYLAEPTRTNAVRNNTMVGAVIGGAKPTNWVVGTAGGVVASVEGVGTVNGVPYVDLRYNGTPAASAPVTIYPEQLGFIPVAVGQQWTVSAHLALVGGSLTNVASLGFGYIEQDSVPSTLSSASLTTTTLTGTMTRYSATRQIAAATAAFANFPVRFNCTAGNPIDITIRIGLPQIELGAFATSPIPTNGTAATRAADVMKIKGAALSAAIGTGSAFSVAAVMVAPASAIYGGGLVAWATANDASPSASDTIYLANATSPANSYQATANTGGANVFTNAATGGNSPPSTTKVAASFSANAFGISHNGATAITDASGNMPATAQTSITIGCDAVTTGSQHNGRIKRLAVFPSALSSADIQGLAA